MVEVGIQPSSSLEIKYFDKEHSTLYFKLQSTDILEGKSLTSCCFSKVSRKLLIKEKGHKRAAELVHPNFSV